MGALAILVLPHVQGSGGAVLMVGISGGAMHRLTLIMEWGGLILTLIMVWRVLGSGQSLLEWDCGFPASLELGWTADTSP